MTITVQYNRSVNNKYSLTLLIYVIIELIYNIYLLTLNIESHYNRTSVHTMDRVQYVIITSYKLHNRTNIQRPVADCLV